MGSAHMRVKTVRPEVGDSVNPRSKRTTFLHKLLLLLVLLACAYQIVILMSSYSGLWLRRAWRTRAVSADGRNALFLLGSRGAAYIEFLDLAIPLDASIAVPEGVGEYSQQSILQFFFMPRTAPGCSCPADASTQPSSACIECLRSEDNYVLSIGDYPPAWVLDGVKRLVPFEQNGGWFHGVYAPLSGESDRHPTGSTNDALPWWSAAIIDLVLVLAVWTLGCNLAALFVNPLGWKEAASLGVPLGFGILTLSVFLLSWARFRLTAWTFVIAWFFLMGVSWLALRLANGGAERVPLREIVTGIVSTKASVSPAVVLLVLVLGFLAAQALVISVSRGYSLFDAIANWALKGYAIALEGTIWAGARWGGHGLAYPQNLHLAIAMFRLFDGDTLPGSKLLDPSYASAMILGIYRLWRQNGTSIRRSLLGGVLLLSTPVFFIHTTIGYANFIFATYLVLGTIWFLEGVDANRPRYLALGALLLGLAGWTRPEGIVFALAIGLPIYLGAWLIRRRKAAMVFALIPFLVVSGVWLTFGGTYARQDETGQIAGRLQAGLADGTIGLAYMSSIVRLAVGRLMSPGLWGIMLPMSVLLLAAAMKKRWSARCLPSLPALLGVLAVLAFELAILLSSSYSWSNFLEDGFDRAFLPAGILVFALLWAEGAGREPEIGLAEPLEHFDQARLTS